VAAVRNRRRSLSHGEGACELKAVILAGGLGTRLSEETDRIPKPMVEIGGKPIIWHIMKIYSHFGIQDFVICLGYKGYLIKEYFHNYFLHNCDVTFDVRTRGVEIHHNQTEEWRVTLVDTGVESLTGGRLRRIARYVDEGTFCMTYGDGLGDIDVGALIDRHKLQGRLATVTAVTAPGRFGVLDIRDDAVQHIREKPAQTETFINGGFFVLEPQALSYIAGDMVLWEVEPMERLAGENQLTAYKHSGFWQPMDTLREKRLLEDLWNTGRAPWKVWA
jgi:glucose-1-phosphate cytidylyltransferase